MVGVVVKMRKHLRRGKGRILMGNFRMDFGENGTKLIAAVRVMPNQIHVLIDAKLQDVVKFPEEITFLRVACTSNTLSSCVVWVALSNGQVWELSPFKQQRKDPQADLLFSNTSLLSQEEDQSNRKLLFTLPAIQSLYYSTKATGECFFLATSLLDATSLFYYEEGKSSGGIHQKILEQLDDGEQPTCLLTVALNQLDAALMLHVVGVEENLQKNVVFQGDQDGFIRVLVFSCSETSHAMKLLPMESLKQPIVAMFAVNLKKNLKKEYNAIVVVGLFGKIAVVCTQQTYYFNLEISPIVSACYVESRNSLIYNNGDGKSYVTSLDQVDISSDLQTMELHIERNVVLFCCPDGDDIVTCLMNNGKLLSFELASATSASRANKKFDRNESKKLLQQIAENTEKNELLIEQSNFLNENITSLNRAVHLMKKISERNISDVVEVKSSASYSDQLDLRIALIPKDASIDFLDWSLSVIVKQNEKVWSGCKPAGTKEIKFSFPDFGESNIPVYLEASLVHFLPVKFEANGKRDSNFIIHLCSHTKLNLIGFEEKNMLKTNFPNSVRALRSAIVLPKDIALRTNNIDWWQVELDLKKEFLYGKNSDYYAVPNQLDFVFSNPQKTISNLLFKDNENSTLIKNDEKCFFTLNSGNLIAFKRSLQHDKLCLIAQTSDPKDLSLVRDVILDKYRNQISNNEMYKSMFCQLSSEMSKSIATLYEIQDSIQDLDVNLFQSKLCSQECVQIVVRYFELEKKICQLYWQMRTIFNKYL